VKQPRSDTAPLEPWREVQVKMRGKFPYDLYGCVFRIVNHGYSSLIGVPAASCFWVWRRILPTQLRPPASFQALFPARGIDSTQHETADAAFVSSHHDQIRIERRIGCGVDGADEVFVMVKARSICARVRCRERNSVESINIA
jgi:hypothetical protein